MANNRRQVKRIDILPDDVLLGIFDFYVDTKSESYYWYRVKPRTEAWISLVHVCRRWRSLVLGSPRRLNLQLYCSPTTSTQDTLDVWPALPLIVRGILTSSLDPSNVLEALEQSNRVCKVNLELGRWQLKDILIMMGLPFPELTDLRLSSDIDSPPAIPDSFLGGSAPRLRIFTLEGIPFPGLPKLLLSATNLVHLFLRYIPHSSYISPQAMIPILSVLSSLRILCLGFQDLESRSFQYRPDPESQILPPPKRSILPALEEFHFQGVTEYLEDLVTFIDAPQLDEMKITFFNQTYFHCPRLAQFINRTSTLWARDKAYVEFDDWSTRVALLGRSKTIEIGTSCTEPNGRLSSIVHICNSPLHPLSTVEDLYIGQQRRPLDWKKSSIEDTLWLQLLLPFIAVKNLYLSKGFAPRIAATLQEFIGRRITEVLPSLQNIFVEGLEPSGPFQENIGQFVTARQLSGHPVAISVWNEPV
ncbi:hypothetical protein V8E52_008972 [Russula decolorans]